jgi:hypothetical protein
MRVDLAAALKESDHNSLAKAKLNHYFGEVYLMLEFL